MPDFHFGSKTLQEHPFGQSIVRIMQAGISSVMPAVALQDQLRREGDTLYLDNQVYALNNWQKIHVLSVGKASSGMAEELAKILGAKISRGLVICKHAAREFANNFKFLTSGHPIPTEASLYAGKQALDFVSGLGEKDLLFLLLSGGGSALMTAPLPGITLEDMQTLTRALLASGASIGEINILRRHLDLVKGGRLALAASPATVIGMALSDVIGDDFADIASGPSAPDSSTKQDAIEIIHRYSLQGKITESIFSALQNSAEAPKSNDVRFKNTSNFLVGSNGQAVEAARWQAEQEGFAARVFKTDLKGEARQRGVELADFLLSANQRPACWIVGGETTVTVKGSGRGGRNTELALSAVEKLAGKANALLITLATDGEDGQTDAAGAVVSGESLARALAFGMSLKDYLENNNSYAFFDKLGDLVKTGPTGTNVNDLTFLFTF